MAKRWTPQRMARLRAIRIGVSIVCVVALVAACFFTLVRKTVTLNYNGEKTTTSTYATSVPGFLRESGVTVKTHDVVQSTTAGKLTDHDTVTVKTAYQTTVTIDGQQVPFWTVAESADQLINFFEQNEVQANRITVDIKNVYNQLTGGFVINTDGPVTVIADGKSSVAPNGKLPAASILDSKGITLGKNDRVSVSKEDGKTVLRVQRVTTKDETVIEDVPFETLTVVDESLAPGETKVQQEGKNGQNKLTYSVTYVDGKEESRKLTATTPISTPVNQIIAIGPAKEESKNTDSGNSSGDSNKSDSSDSSSNSDKSSNSEDSNSSKDSEDSNSSSNANNSNDSDDSKDDSQATASPTQKPTQTPTQKPTQTPTQKPTQTPTQEPTQQPTQQPTTPSTPSDCRLCKPSPSAAQAYAAGAAAQYGWTGANWTALVKLWNRESSWLWYAENPSTHAYGIPQSLPGKKMADYGANWKEDAAAQIDWGLNYISGTYGSPLKAWEHSEKYGWY